MRSRFLVGSQRSTRNSKPCSIYICSERHSAMQELAEELGGRSSRRTTVTVKMVLAGKVPYEECRRKRLEENQKRMEALNLPLLAQSLRRSSSLSPSPSPMKHAKRRTVEKQVVVVRRSERVANIPAPAYNVVVDRISTPRRIYKQRDPPSIMYASEEAREYTIEKAEELQSTLGSQCPTLVRTMLPSHVSGGFWLGLPSHFCKTSLPHRDGMITLVDEEGEEFPTVYLARKSGLSGGWKGFSVAHNLTYGDTLVFQLTQSTVMKVYIIRVSSYEEGKKL